MKQPRGLFTATLLPNGKVLVAGGFKLNHGELSSAELYDPATGKWTYTGSLVEPRELHTATLLPNGQVLVTGGYNLPNGSLASAELYNPVRGTWTATGSMTVVRFSHTATLLPDGKVLAAGGYGEGGVGDILASAELYDPVTGTFTRTGDMNDARAVYTATLLTTGDVLVAGGYPGPLASAELYDPGD
jgi:hypothetical protein